VFRRRFGEIEGTGKGLVEVDREEMDLLVLAGTKSEIDRFVDGCGQDKTLVVISVLTDQVDAAG
jgi:hypothetical protein